MLIVTVFLLQFVFIKYFFVFCVNDHTAKEPEVANEGFGMLEGNWKQQRIWGESWDSCFINVLLSLIYEYVLIYVNVQIAVCKVIFIKPRGK